MSSDCEAEYDVLRFCDIDSQELTELLTAYQIELCLTPDDEPVLGSFWGDEEAGLIGERLNLNTNTPIHSISHTSATTQLSMALFQPTIWIYHQRLGPK